MVTFSKRRNTSAVTSSAPHCAPSGPWSRVAYLSLEQEMSPAAKIRAAAGVPIAAWVTPSSQTVVPDLRWARLASPSCPPALSPQQKSADFAAIPTHAWIAPVASAEIVPRVIGTIT